MKCGKSRRINSMIVLIGGYILLTAAYVFFKVVPILLLLLAAVSVIGMGGGIWMLGKNHHYCF